jgi:carbamoyltransferase
MTTILGIHPGHDAGAALIKDGKILAATDEERFRRRKFWGGGYPENSVKFVLEYTKTNIEDIDAVAIPAKRFSKIELFKLGIRYLRYPQILKNKMQKSKDNKIGYAYHSDVVRKGLIKQFSKCPRIIGVDHHMAHAAAAYYTSGLKEPIIITSDGVGGSISSTVNITRNRKIERIADSLEPGSLGHFYEALTEGLGFLINSDEYKVMGMAAYGDWKKGGYKELLNLAPKLDGLIFRRKPWKIYSEYKNNFWNVHIGESGFVKLLIDRYGKLDVAAAGQRVLEDLLLQWIKNIIKKTKKKQFCAAGGTFLNVKANQRIRDELGVELFVFPHAGDGGLSVGCALYVNSLLNPRTNFKKIESLALGPEYSNEDIEKELKKTSGIKYTKVKNIENISSTYIAKGKILGWFQGRMEYGPRALGNRSIIANPTKNKYKDKVNIKVKFREEWRPFCPSMIEEESSKYLINKDEAPFMITAFDVPKDKIIKIEGVVHIDGTTRPQIVKKNVYPKYWNLIRNVGEKIGVSVVLNTSFNRKGEPIVCSPKDALNTFLNCGMDYLAIGDFWVEKKKKR